MEVADFYRFPQRIRLSKFKQLLKEAKLAYLNSLKKMQPLVEIYAFAFMPNHYHLLLKQAQDGGISRFISNFQNSFAKIFNLKNNRTGGLFQNQFRARRIETDEEFLHVSRYIHLNPVTSYIISFKDLANYPWTSLPSYLQRNQNLEVSTNQVLGMVGSASQYLKFIEDQVDYQQTLQAIKNLIVE